MKTRISILLILLAMLVFTYLLLQRVRVITPHFTRYRSVDLAKPKLVEALEKNRESVMAIQNRQRWLITRLEKCVDVMEKDRGLAAITDVNDLPNAISYPSKDTSEIPFYQPYKKPDKMSEEVDVVCAQDNLIARINFATLSHAMAMYNYDARISYLEKRLERLDKLINEDGQE